MHFLQIWIVPDQRGLRAAYAQQTFDAEAAGRGFVLLASREGRDGSIGVHQDVDLWVTRFAPGDRRSLDLEASGEGRQGAHS